MLRPMLLLFPLALQAMAAQPTEYSTDIVTIEDGQVIQKTRLRVAGQRSRVDGLTAGSLGRISTIALRDRGVVWTLYLDQRQYAETPISANRPAGAPDMANLDLSRMRKEFLGRETVLGQACSKLHVVLGNMPNTRPLNATVWLSDSLNLPVRIETLGIVQENHNLRAGPQPANAFEIPAGFVRTNSPGAPPPRRDDIAPRTGTVPATGGSAAGRIAQAVADALNGRTSDPGEAPRRYDDRVQTAAGQNTQPAWRQNTNYPGGDFRSIDMATSDPTACKNACDRDSRCLAWTLVKPESPGGMGYCWLKDSIPEAIREDCCISGLKGAGGAVSGTSGKRGTATAATKPAPPAWKVNTNLPGGDFVSIDMRTSDPRACKAACDKESRCRAWTLVKPEEPGGMGYCWLKDSVPEEIREDCCISGVKP
jgi:hypothetical protein